MKLANLFQHTAARRRLFYFAGVLFFGVSVSTHSRPKAAAPRVIRGKETKMFQHTAARRRLIDTTDLYAEDVQFQHTAARRRLMRDWIFAIPNLVSTHSRPKAAGRSPKLRRVKSWFQHTAARRRLPRITSPFVAPKSFNTQPPEGG